MGAAFSLGYFTLLAALFLAKLLPFWNSLIPGGQQDTRLFLWNTWWFNHAVSVLHTNPYRTDMLFFPFGCRLISHDFPLWMNLVTFAGQRAGLTMIAASNLWFALSWILLGFCTYLLAKELSGSPAASLAAGTLAMTHSYTLARAMQNWGQFNVYGIALFLWCLVRARRRKNAMGFVIAGAALAWTAACHFYFLIYSAIIWLAVVFVDCSPFQVRLAWRKSLGGAIRPLLMALAGIAGMAGLISALHPAVYSWAGRDISMLSPENPLFVMWLLLMAWGATYIKIEITKIVPGTIFGRFHMMLGGTAAVFLTPLVWETIRLIGEGGYPKQSILWKTHNTGANLLSPFMPNALHALWGPAVSQWFTARQMQPQEQAASIGWVCLAVVMISGLWKEGGRAKRWLYLALASTVFAMGTHLHIAEFNLWCPLPFFWLRLLPIIGNVRIPERWMAVGAVAWSVVLAMAIVKLSQKKKWPLRPICAAVTALVLLENWPGIPFRAPPVPSGIYQRLKALPPGAILPIPLYIGDSSVGTGDALTVGYIFPWDHLWAQVWHEKPVLGGYIGRIPRKLITQYKADSFIRTILDLEERKPVTAAASIQAGRAALEKFKFEYVLVYPGCTDPQALRYVLGSLPLKLVAQDPSIRLYRVELNSTRY